MEDREERGVKLSPVADGLDRMNPDEVPDDVLAERDAEERQARGDLLGSPAVQEVAEDVLAEQDGDARAAEEALHQRQTGG
jgi:hypothetical protein